MLSNCKTVSCPALCDYFGDQVVTPASVGPTSYRTGKTSNCQYSQQAASFSTQTERRVNARACRTSLCITFQDRGENGGEDDENGGEDGGTYEVLRPG